MTILNTFFIRQCSVGFLRTCCKSNYKFKSMSMFFFIMLLLLSSLICPNLKWKLQFHRSVVFLLPPFTLHATFGIDLSSQFSFQTSAVQELSPNLSINFNSMFMCVCFTTLNLSQHKFDVHYQQPFHNTENELCFTFSFVQSNSEKLSKKIRILYTAYLHLHHDNILKYQFGIWELVSQH